jgi:hypothetical protein
LLQEIKRQYTVTQLNPGCTPSPLFNLVQQGVAIGLGREVQNVPRLALILPIRVIAWDMTTIG